MWIDSVCYMCVHVYKRECPWKESKERRMRCRGENIIYCRNRKNKNEVKTKQSQSATITSIHLLLTSNAQTEEKKIEPPKKSDVLLIFSGFAHRIRGIAFVFCYLSCCRSQSVLCWVREEKRCCNYYIWEANVEKQVA